MVYNAANASTYEAAWIAWIVACSGLSGGQVRWDDGKPRPAGTYISVGISETEELSNGWVKHIRESGNVVRKSRAPTRVVLTLTCTSTSPAGATHARAILADMQRRAEFSENGKILRDAGIAYLGFEQIRVVQPTQNFAVFEPRAIVLVAFNVAAELSVTSTSGAIEHVETTPTIDDTELPPFTVDK